MSEIYREPLFRAFTILGEYLNLSPLERVAYDCALVEKLDDQRKTELIQYARQLGEAT